MNALRPPSSSPTATPAPRPAAPRALIAPFVLSLSITAGVALVIGAGIQRPSPGSIALGLLLLAAGIVSLRACWARLLRAVDASPDPAKSYEDLYENAPDLYLSVDARTARLIQCNRTMTRVTGFDREELLGREVLDLYDPSCHPQVRDAFRIFQETGEVRGAELLLRRKEAPPLEVELSVSALLDADGHIARSRSMLRDISARKAAERALERKNAELEEFAALASHDLQAPLRTLTTCCEILAEDHGAELPPASKQHIERIVQGCGRMRELIQSLLAYSRLDAREFVPEPVALNEVFDQALEQLAADVEASGVRVQRDDLPVVQGDPRLLRELFVDLVENAIKYRGTEEPFVHARALRLDDGPAVAVDDNGIGIAAKDHERIFAAFKRLHSEQEYAGTGIGLASAHRIVQRHQGKLWVESSPGAGSSFRFRLPGMSPPD